VVASKETHTRSAAVRSHANQQPALSQKLDDFLKLESFTECATYCKQNPGIWGENIDSLRSRAVQALRQGQAANARKLAERWLMLARAQRMELPVSQACDWFLRIEQRQSTKLGFEKDVDDLIGTLSHAVDSAQSYSNMARTSPAGLTTGTSRHNVPQTSVAAVAMDTRSSSSSLVEPTRIDLRASPITMPFRTSGLDTPTNMGLQHSEPSPAMALGSFPGSRAAAGMGTMPSGANTSPWIRNPDSRTSQGYNVFTPQEPRLRSSLELTGGTAVGTYAIAQSSAETASAVLSESNTLETERMSLRGAAPDLRQNNKGLGPKLNLLEGYDQQKKAELDRSYYVRYGKAAEQFFIRGRVFGMVWHENAGSGMKPNQTVVSEKLDRPFHRFTLSKDNVQIFSHIRRFVVVKARRGYCWAIPINSYGNRGLLDKRFSGAEQRAHTIVYGSGDRPRTIKNEPKFTKAPIAVTLTAGEELFLTSRLHFDKPQSIDWNIRVKDIGMVEGEPHARHLITYFRYEFNRGEEATASEEEME